METSPAITNKDFPTKDTALAAYLISEGFELQDINRTNPKSCIFYFKNDNPKLTEFIRSYQIGKAEGNISSFIMCYRQLLTEVHAG